MFALPSTTLRASRMLPRMALPGRAAAIMTARPMAIRSLATSALVKAENQRSQAPASENWDHAKQNVKEDVVRGVKAAQSTIAGGQLSPDEAKHVDKLYKEPISGASGDESITHSLKQGLHETEDMLHDVPQAAKAWGAAGSIPIWASAGASVYYTREALFAHLANNPENMNQFLELAQQAEWAQITISAVLLSFVGAMHWGLEFAGYGGRHGNQRLAMGVAPFTLGWASLALAPTSTLGLVASWFSWVAAWGIDMKASKFGWTPRWYSTYRFWLTTVVGTSLFATLVGNQYYQPAKDIGARAQPDDRIKSVIKAQHEDEPQGHITIGNSTFERYELPEGTEYTTELGSKLDKGYYVVLQEFKGGEEEEEAEEEGQGEGGASEGGESGEVEGEGAAEGATEGGEKGEQSQEESGDKSQEESGDKSQEGGEQEQGQESKSEGGSDE